MYALLGVSWPPNIFYSTVHIVRLYVDRARDLKSNPNVTGGARFGAACRSCFLHGANKTKKRRMLRKGRCQSKESNAALPGYGTVLVPADRYCALFVCTLIFYFVRDNNTTNKRTVYGINPLPSIHPSIHTNTVT